MICCGSKFKLVAAKILTACVSVPSDGGGFSRIVGCVMSLRPFRFALGPAGLHGHEPQSSGAGWAALARRAEDLGYSALHLGDHLDDRLAPIAAAMAAADATARLRVATFTLNNELRNPVVLAKEMATVDALSGGRLEVGLGAGWLQGDFDAAGIALEPASVRIERLGESVRILKLLLSEPAATFHGDHFSVDGAKGLPEPVQRPRPPIVLGGGGRKMLTLAGREADIVSVNANLGGKRIGEAFGATQSAQAAGEKIEWVRDAAGDRFDTLELHIFVAAVELTQDRPDALTRAATMLGLTAEDTDVSPHALIGTAAEIAETLRARREQYGFSYISVSARWMDDFAPVVAELAGQ